MSNSETPNPAPPAPPAPSAPAQLPEAHREVAAISLALRIPPFWRDQPRLWFVNFEAATAELKRSQNQLAQMVIAQLEKQDIQELTDILYNPPAQNYYSTIKERLIRLYEDSDSKQIKKLLSEMELGEQKSSQLLRRMRDLARDKFTDDTIRIMWMNHLPAHIRSVLIVSETFNNKASLDELAALADKMLEESPQIAAISTPHFAAPQIAAVSTQHFAAQPASSQASNVDTQFLINEIRRLSLEVAELRSRPQRNDNYNRSMNNRTRFRSRSRNGSQTQDRSRKNSPMPYCYYHHRFGMDAKKCSPPCSFKTIDPEN